MFRDAESAHGRRDRSVLLGERVARGRVVCLCDRRFPLTSNADAVPLWDL